MEAQRDAMKSENLKLQAQVNPLQCEVERLTQKIDQMQKPAVSHDNVLDEQAEAILLAIAINERFPEDQLPFAVGITTAKAAYCISLLLQKSFIIQISYEPMSYRPTHEGFAYLNQRGKL